MPKPKTMQARYRPGTDRCEGKFVVEWQSPAMQAPAFDVKDTEAEAKDMVDRLLGRTPADGPRPFTCPACGGPVWCRVESNVDPETGRPYSSITSYECEASCRGTISADQMKAHAKAAWQSRRP